MKEHLSIVTGGAGFIGSHLVDALLDRGDRVIVVDDMSTGFQDNLAGALRSDRCKLLVADIAHVTPEDLGLTESSTIYHLAASVGVEHVTTDPMKTILNNLNSTHRVLDLALSRNVPVFIASSSEVYGEKCLAPHKEDQPLTLGSTTEPRWGYAYSKAISECMGLAYARDHDLPVVIGRLFNVAGPRQQGSYGMVLPKFVSQAIQDKPLTVYGDGSQQRCFADVEDVVSYIMALMGTPDAYGEVFNVGNDAELSIKELGERIIETLGSRSTIEFVPTERLFRYFVDVDRRVPDLDKLRSVLNVAPSIKLEQTIASIAAYEEMALAG
jgi:UDP-glucose 4-epimerase